MRLKGLRKTLISSYLLTVGKVVLLLKFSELERFFFVLAVILAKPKEFSSKFKFVVIKFKIVMDE